MPPRDQRSGINRSLMWLRKALQITEQTDSPRVLSEIVGPTMDLFGWERLGEITVENLVSTDTTFRGGSVVPADTFRLILAASAEHSDTVGGHTLWINHQVLNPATNIAVVTPFVAGPSAAGNPIAVALIGRLLLRPGESIQARSSPATGAGNTLNIRSAFIEFPAGGEYVYPI